MSDKEIVGTDDNFDEIVLRSDIPVLVDFWATWCGPCISMAPTVEEIAKEYADRLKVVKLDIDKNPTTTSKFDIRSIPTLMIFKDGEIIRRVVGGRPKQVLLKMIDATI